jgi:two-component system sensor kinase FixL
VDELASINVLIIEDDADTLATLRDILELDDYHVQTAANAAQALNRDDWYRLSAIVLDRQLPDATADMLLPKLRGLAPEAAVIVVTGYADIQGAIAALRQGATDYILKPLNVDILRASLGRVSERRRLTLAKERSEAAFRHLVEAAACLIIILRPDLSVFYLNPFAEQLIGYATREVRGRDFFSLFLTGSDRDSVRSEFERVLAGSPMLGLQNRIVCRDDSRHWIVWTARYLGDYDGKPALLAVGQDITNLKQAQARALQSERLAAIGQMVTGLAHESRNALQRSQACLEMLALTLQDRPESLELIARIQKAQDHLHHLYEDVRSYAAPIALERRDCDVAEVWREAWSHLDAAREGKQAVLREELNGVATHCQGDPFRLEQVFRNIFENALAAGPPPVQIVVHAEPAEVFGLPGLRVVVHDNGPGLNAEQKRQVFEPFYTTKAKGTGLGMPIAKRIVEAHGGQIAVGEDNVPGAVFSITLPRGDP